MHTRLIEELSELAEAMRFVHLYPSNFDNEIADYFAWWFALASSSHLLKENNAPMLLAGEFLWQAYPGHCPVCTMLPCDCRPGPVRELLSKPALNDLALIDALTHASNRAAYDQDLADVKQGKKTFALPIACVRIDVDHFKKINDGFKHIVNAIRQKVRPRDRLYRVGGDEFALMCPDLSSTEATGMMSRVARSLKEKPLSGLKRDGQTQSIVVTLSVGVCECLEPARIHEAFDSADKAAISSKEKGRDLITTEQLTDVQLAPKATV
jgi:diguanylate cyclase (GGDEF)-like protein